LVRERLSLTHPQYEKLTKSSDKLFALIGANSFFYLITSESGAYLSSSHIHFTKSSILAGETDWMISKMLDYEDRFFDEFEEVHFGILKAPFTVLPNQLGRSEKKWLDFALPKNKNEDYFINNIQGQKSSLHFILRSSFTENAEMYFSEISYHHIIACLIREFKKSNQDGLFCMWREQSLFVVLLEQENCSFQNIFTVFSNKDLLYFINLIFLQRALSKEKTKVWLSGGIDQDAEELIKKYFPKVGRPIASNFEGIFTNNNISYADVIDLIALSTCEL